MEMKYLPVIFKRYMMLYFKMSSVTIIQYYVSWSYAKNLERKSQEFELWSLQSQDSNFR